LPTPAGSARIGVAWHLPQVLEEFGVALRGVLDAARIRTTIFSDRDNLISYSDFGRLLLECERRTNCDHVALLIAQRTHLIDLGLVGRAAACAATAGQGLEAFAELHSLQSTASAVSLIESGVQARFVYWVSEQRMTDTRPFQLGAMAVAHNVIQELCGRAWRPTLVTIAARPPSNPRACLQFFGAPVAFDSDESAIVFERHWLRQPLPPADPAFYQQVMDELRARRATILANFPDVVRRIVHKQLLIGDGSMERVAAVLGMHRRTLDRRLQQHGLRYQELLESVKDTVARQLLRDTRLPMQRIAELLGFSSAANFATAFRRWTGMTPSEFRRRAR
jgi:AraC-like DNA-binding protein